MRCCKVEVYANQKKETMPMAVFMLEQCARDVQTYDGSSMLFALCKTERISEMYAYSPGNDISGIFRIIRLLLVCNHVTLPFQLTGK